MFRSAKLTWKRDFWQGKTTRILLECAIMPPPIHIERTVALPVAPDRLWPILADTEVVNREVGRPSDSPVMPGYSR